MPSYTFFRSIYAFIHIFENLTSKPLYIFLRSIKTEMLMNYKCMVIRKSRTEGFRRRKKGAVKATECLQIVIGVSSDLLMIENS